MRRVFGFTLAMVAVFSLFRVAAASAQELSPERFRYLAEEYYPVCFVEDGKARGLGVDIMNMLWDRMGVWEQRILIMPWARIYREALDRPGTMVLGMARTPEREKSFKWVGPIGSARFVLVARKDAGLEINSPEDLAGLTVGTMRNDIAEKLLEPLNGTVRIESVSDMRTTMRMLRHGRIDMVTYGMGEGSDRLFGNGLDSGEYEVVYEIGTVDMCLAFHKDTPQELVDRFQEALDQGKRSGAFEELRQRYRSQALN